jgi:PAS domain S-box-containing protein
MHSRESQLSAPRETRLARTPGWQVTLAYTVLVTGWGLLLRAAAWPAAYMWFLGIPVFIVALHHPRAPFAPMTLILTAVTLWLNYQTPADFSLALKFTPLAGLALLGVMSIIHQRVRTQAQIQAALQRRNQELQALNVVTGAASATLDLEQVLQQLVDTVEETFPQATAATLQLLDERDGALRTQAASPGAASGEPRVVFQPGKGVTGLALAERRTINVSDVNTDPRYLPGSTPPRYRSLLATPLATGQRVWGTLSVESQTPGAFRAKDERLIESVARQAASAIENAWLFKRLSTAEARYRALFQDSADPIAIMDTQGVLLELNPAACALFGQSREELLGQSASIISKIPEQRFRQVVERILQSQLFTYEFSIATVDGKTRHFQARVERIDYANERALQWVAHDVTHQRDLDHWREELGGIVVHNLRNPLTWVKSGTEMALMYLPQDIDPDVPQALNTAIKGTARLEQQIDVLLNINRAESGQALTGREQLSPARLVNDVIELMVPRAASRQVHLQVEADDSLPPVLGNRHMLALALENLVDNATKFSPQGKAVSVQVQAEQDALRISVRDRGPGVPPAERERIFEKFYRVRQHQKKGAGMGLYFCKLAVEAHGGQIWVQDNDEGQGSTFSFTLPLQSMEQE